MWNHDFFFLGMSFFFASFTLVHFFCLFVCFATLLKYHLERNRNVSRAAQVFQLGGEVKAPLTKLSAAEFTGEKSIKQKQNNKNVKDKAGSYPEHDESFGSNQSTSVC